MCLELDFTTVHCISKILLTSRKTQIQECTELGLGCTSTPKRACDTVFQKASAARYELFLSVTLTGGRGKTFRRRDAASDQESGGQSHANPLDYNSVDRVVGPKEDCRRRRRIIRSIVHPCTRYGSTRFIFVRRFSRRKSVRIKA